MPRTCRRRYDYATLLENVMDVSHVPFTHHLTVGNRKNAAPVDLELGEAGVQANGFTGLWQEARTEQLAQPLAVAAAPMATRRPLAVTGGTHSLSFSGFRVPQGPRRGALGSQFTTFTAPTLMVHRLTSKAFGAHAACSIPTSWPRLLEHLRQCCVPWFRWAMHIVIVVRFMRCAAQV